MDEEEDYDIDDILNNKHKKRKDSGDKGKRGERSLIKELEKRFPNIPFSRTVGSGNRWSQARLTETAKQVFTGDIITPNSFKFCLEIKNGYDIINLERAIKKGNKLLDGFLIQAEKDGERVNKAPLLCWKRSYKPWITFLKDFPSDLSYKNWYIVSLSKLFEQPDTFFFGD